MSLSRLFLQFQPNEDITTLLTFWPQCCGLHQSTGLMITNSWDAHGNHSYVYLFSIIQKCHQHTYIYLFHIEEISGTTLAGLKIRQLNLSLSQMFWPQSWGLHKWWCCMVHDTENLQFSAEFRSAPSQVAANRHPKSHRQSMRNMQMFRTRRFYVHKENGKVCSYVCTVCTVLGTMAHSVQFLDIHTQWLMIHDILLATPPLQ